MKEYGKNLSSHWFWHPVRTQVTKYGRVLVASVFINIFALLSSFYVMVVYDRVVPNDAFTTLWTLSSGMAIIIVTDFALKMLRGTFADLAGEHIDKSVGARVFQHLARNYNLATQRQSGAISATVREFETIKETLSSATFTFLVDVPFVVLFLAVLWWVASYVAVVPATVSLIILLAGFLTHKMTKNATSQGVQNVQNKQGLLVELVSGMETAKTLPGLDMLESRWEKSVERQAKQSSKLKHISLICVTVAQSGQTINQIGIVVLGVMLISQGALTMGQLVACVILGGRAIAPMAQVASLISRLSMSAAAYRALDGLMSVEDSEHASSQFVRLPPASLKGEIELKAVEFAYNEGAKRVLNEASHTFGAGSKTAIVGSIGAGKSSIVRLICGLVQPSQGQVLFDGHDITHLNPQDLRESIGVMFQVPVIFSGTLVDNIRLGKPDASDEEIVAAAGIAGVLNFADSLQDGLNTYLFERGAQLSGGQRQAICLARLVLANPQVVVLDEPTSALDPHSERELIQRLKEWAKDKTVIVITHKSSALELVDKVMVLDQGKLFNSASRKNTNRSEVRNEAD